MREQAERIVSQLTLDEKISLLTGKDFWRTKSIDRVGLNSIMLSDGPHGLRKQGEESDHLGLNESIVSVCFPTASAVACTFNEELVERMGRSLGSNSADEEVKVLLGPGNNIKRSPLCGRNFEYFSEDPLLAGKITSAMIKGIQSQGVACSVKHFAVNNQEELRMVVNAVVDERTLREIYLTAFEIPVKESNPWTIMSAYNRINGIYASENNRLLNEILRDEWGFDGLVVSDWGAVDHLYKAIANGMDLEMPTSREVGVDNVKKALADNLITEEQINVAATNLVYLTSRGNEITPDTFDIDQAHHLAREVAEEAIVLLKNDNSLLPITADKYQSIGLIGGFAVTPRYQGSGSSRVNSYKVTTLLESFVETFGAKQVTFAQGYDVSTDVPSQTLMNQAIEVAKSSDVVVLSVGLTDDYESEGLDRDHLNLPTNHIALIEEVMKHNKNVVMVLSNGSAIKIPFKDECPAIVEGWLSGESGAEAMVNILSGKANPSGRLAETFILNESQDPAAGNFPGTNHEVVYEEGIFIGYRAHQKERNTVQFPFGFGLSYTNFDYSDLTVDVIGKEEARVSVVIHNTGLVDGKEVIQLYVNENNPLLTRPVRELKRFDKVFLKAGESKTVTFSLDRRCFAFFNTEIQDWSVNTGEFTIEIGKSCEDIQCSSTVHIESFESNVRATDQRTYVGREVFSKGQKVNRNTTVSDLETHPTGRLLYNKIMNAVNPEEAGDVLCEKALISMIRDLPLRNLSLFAGEEDAMDEKSLDFIIKAMNATSQDKLLGKIVGLATRFSK
ncbi:glycoside hydrolase family 3 C-terminal domain-containing protein [Vibrio cortegadensis]|uniref:glycoside hydrolase family 3 C-terminal domain-containing protein n=1 Tax=Vibrio cortegadensis TaxID=1328770 RepID=UPI0021C4862D|nr:glycoside hydrolase family 3 C-terminal domain-containing protein [Vibrio cortegadensis]MDN3697542.1 glycoside hydrolase family 3 C-terminal domain-containing protein [Vibrio cortegadensis]